MTHDPLIFNRQRVRLHRDRAARHSNNDFLLRALSERLAERLMDINRTFPRVLDLGAHNGLLADYFTSKTGSDILVQSDLSEKLLRSSATRHPLPATRITTDDELLPFAENSFDVVVSAGSLHWVNDVPGTLAQIHRILKPDGVFLANFPGGETLKELRRAFEQAELSISGGLSPRVSPFVDVRDGGSLLQRAGFALPVADSEILTVTYEHPLKLLHDLKNMGEANAMLHSRKGFTPCSLMMLMADNYMREFSDDDGRIRATFEIITLTGWKPALKNQMK